MAKQWCQAHEREHVATAFSSSRAKQCKRASAASKKRSSRGARLLRMFGITLDEYDELLAAQDGRCAICRGTRKYNLHVDHDHERERELLADGLSAQDAARLSIRGLLCARCNKLLRDARDAAVLLSSAVAYLRHPPALKVLNRRRHSAKSRREAKEATC